MKYADYLLGWPIVYDTKLRKRWYGKGYKKRHGRARAKFFETGKHNLKRPRKK